ncbi:MAG: hypothetical protein GXX09_01630 [Syntrophomonadaceae bacterium]|nr:hypothetical protein [Syntrophomonadaceae bacterium]
MDPKQLIQQCIQRCQTSMSEMQQAANMVTNPNAKSNLQQSAQQIQNCINMCQQAMNQI